MRRPNLNEIREQFAFNPIPQEGGEMSPVHLFEEKISTECLPERYRGSRYMGSAIYFLLTHEEDSFSALHRLNTSETYHFYIGDPVELYLFHSDENVQRFFLGSDIKAGQRVMLTTPVGVWQCSRLIPGGEYALMGATMAPGFDPDDFTLGERQFLMDTFPRHTELIREFTRNE